MVCTAIVPAKDRADTIQSTVRALQAVPDVGEILVVDDGSTDNTADLARSAGAEVICLDRNLGKGGAVAAAVKVRPESDVYLLIDADLGETAVSAGPLLDRVLGGHTEMAIAIPVAAGTRGGFGIVKRVAGEAIEQATSRRMQAPLSGQRAVVGARLRSIELAPRFGLEVAMSIDLLRAGCSYEELDLPIEHHHTGRTFAGFRHRAGQGIDICRAVVPRIGLKGLSGVLVRSLRNKDSSIEGTVTR